MRPTRAWRSSSAPVLKPLATAVALALLFPGGIIGHASAAPTGGQVTAGSATIQQPNAQTLVVEQSSARAALDWKSFSIGAGESVVFRQPSSSAVALNRVIGAEPSMIFGRLQANGNVFLVNPNGVTFARGASVDVGGLVASTLGISTQDFMAGRYFFSGGAGAGSVVNHATIRAADGGYVALIGSQVTNTGAIVANRGSVALAAGNTMLLDFDGDGLLNIKVDTDAAAARVDHSGLIQADGGRVIMSVRAKNALMATALNVDGVVNARSLVERGGAIYLDGGRSGVTRLTGTLDASGSQAGARGGDVRVLGEYVGLFGTALIDASGPAGGGTVLVGGDFQGANAAIPNARQTIVDRNARIFADAAARGDGGKVIVWSDDTTQMLGKIFARGGTERGDGGFVEVSGKARLAFRGRVDTTAPNGKTGTLLLDPATLTIKGGDGDSDAAVSGDGNATFAGTPGGGVGGIAFDDANLSTVFESEIEEQSKTTNILLQAQRTINVDNVAFTHASGNPGDGAGILALAANRTLRIETRNNGVGESGSIDLVTGGAHGVNLGIVTSGTGGLTVLTGSGGNQATSIRLPDLSGGTLGVTVSALQGGSIDVHGISTAGLGGAVGVSSAGANAGAVSIAGNVVTTGGVGQAGGAVTVTGSTVSVAAITTPGGADVVSTPPGTGGAISLTANGTTPTITLNGNLTAVGGTATNAGNSGGNGGAITLNSPVVLGANVTLDSHGGTGPSGSGVGGNIRFVSNIDADAGANNRTLAVDAGTGTATFSGGMGLTPLADFDVTAGSIVFNAAGSPQTLNVTAQGGNTLTFNGPVSVAQNLVLNTGGGTPNNVTFNAAVDADSSTSNRTLQVAAGTGTVRFNGNVGAGQAFADLDVTAGSIDFFGAGAQSVNVTSGGGNTVTFAGPVRLGNNVTMNTAGTNNQSYTSTIDADAAVVARTLTLNAGAGGTIDVSGAIGGTQALSGLTITNSNGTTFNGPVNVTRAGGVIDIAATTAGQTVSFNGNVTALGLTTAAGGYNVSLTGANTTISTAVNFLNTGTVTLGDAAADVLLFDGGLATAFNATNPSLTRLGGTVRTSGDAVTLGPVALIGNATVDSTNNGSVPAGAGVSFASTINADAVANNRTLTLNAGAASARFEGDIGTTQALADLDVTAAGSIVTNTSPQTMTVTAQGGNTLTFNGPLSLPAGLTLNTGTNNVTFTGTIQSSDGAVPLTVNSGGTTTFAGAVGGGGSALSSLVTDAAGTTVLAGIPITTTGAQAYGDPVTLTTGSSTLTAGGAVTFGSTVQSPGTAQALVVNAAGDTTFGGAVGGGNPLASLTTGAGGRTLINGGAVTTTGDQVYGDAVTLGANTVLTGATPTFGSTVTGGGFDLALNFSGPTAIAGASVTGVRNLSTGNGGTTTLSGTIATTGTQSYGDAVVLGADTTVSAGTNAVTFGNTINGGFALTVSGSGATTFGGAVGGGTAPTSLTTNGSTSIAGGAITTAGPQSYGAVTLGADAVLSAGANPITFGGTVDGAFALTANSTGATIFAGAVGGTTALASLSTNAGGTTTLSGGSITTTGAQSYGDPVVLAANTVASAGAGAITFGGPLNGAFALTANTTGATTFGGAVGGSTALTSLTTNAGGSTTLSGGTVTTTGAQSYADAVVLGADTVTSAGAGAITFGGTVNGAFALTANSTGVTTFGGAVGGGTALTSLTTNAGGSTNIAGGAIATTGTQTYNDAVVLGSNATLTSSAGNITFASTIDADAAANNRTLTVSAPAGEVTFSGNVGAAQALADLDVTGGGSTIVFNAATPQAVTATQQGGNTITFSGPVLLLQNVTITTAPNSLTFTGPVNADSAANNRTLTLNAGTGSIGVGVVGNLVPLGTFTATGDSIAINGNVTAQQISLTSNTLTTPGGTLNALRPFTTFNDTDAALTLTGLSGAGTFGTAASALSVNSSGLLVVSPNQPASLPAVYIAGTTLPSYVGRNNSAFRLVCYNGQCSTRGTLADIVSIVEAPARQAALAAVLDQLRKLLDEVLMAGYARENVRKQLTQGLVLEAGRARPGIDEFTGDGVAPPASCSAGSAGLGSGVLSCGK